MKRLLLFFLVCDFFLIGETERTTCITNDQKQEECIKTVCDKAGVCTDSMLNKQTNKTASIQISPEAIQLALQNIDSLRKESIKLSDGSIWNAWDKNAVAIQQWLESKPVFVYLTHPVTYAESSYRLVNVNSDEGVILEYDNATFAGEPSEVKRTIASHDKKAAMICLNDGSCWNYDPLLVPQSFERVIVEGNPALIGVNATFFKEDFPNLLILLQTTKSPTAIAVKQVSKNETP